MPNKLDKLIYDIDQANKRHTKNMQSVITAADEHLNPTLPDSGARSEFATGAVRDASEGKGNPSLIPIDALRAVSKRFEDGATKYGRDNWQQGIPLSRYVDSLYRHLWQFMEGDDTEDISERKQEDDDAWATLLSIRGARSKLTQKQGNQGVFWRRRCSSGPFLRRRGAHVSWEARRRRRRSGGG